MLGYNIKIFHYEDGVQVRLYKKPVVVGYSKGMMKNEKVLDDLDSGDLFSLELIEGDNDKGKSERSSYVSSSRSKQMICGIARSNVWDYFLTLTFDRNITDSSDYRFVTKRATEWLNNIKKRFCPDLKYLIVPELHSDGVHWHLHGLLADCVGLKFSVSGYKTPGGLPIYNLQNWRYGFSTVTPVFDSGRVSFYISKYITKDLADALKGRQRYWASNNCLRANDVCECDFLSGSYEDLINQYSKNSKYMSQRSSIDGTQVITYIELGAEGFL